jgi:ABC-type transport system substrate-binding protein
MTITALLHARPFRAALGFGIVAILGGCSNNPNRADWDAQDTYFVVLGGEPTSFDPSVSYNGGDSPVMDLIYPSYYRYNYLKEDPWDLQLNVGLKEPVRVPFAGVEHTAKGNKAFKGETWTFEIRHDLRYCDDPCFPGGRGRNVVAKDLEYTIKRMADPKVEFPLSGNLADKLLGWDEFTKGFSTFGPQNYNRSIDGVTVDPVNPYRFSVTFKEPYPQFRYLMSMHFTTPIPREAVEKYGDQFALHHLVGCGIYRMAEYIPHERIVLVPNKNSPGEFYPTSGVPGIDPTLLKDAGRHMPFMRRIVYKIVTETITSYNLFSQGYFDELGLSQGNAPVLLHSLKPGAEMRLRGIDLLKGAYPAIDYLGFNMEDPTFGGYTQAKRKLRQAISLAIDSKAYIDLINQGLGQPRQFLLVPGLCGYDPNFVNPYRQYDPKLTRAKELLAEAGYPAGIDPKTGERLTINFDNSVESPTDRARELFFRKELEALGLKVVSRDSTYATFIEKTNHKKIQFFSWGWYADYPDAEDFLFLFYGPNAAPGPNTVCYRNPEYDRLFEQVRGMDNSPARAAIIHRMRDIAVEDCPWIYLFQNEAPVSFQPWVRNRWDNPILSDTIKYKNVAVAQRLQRQHDWNQPLWAPLAGVLAVLILGFIPAARTVNRQRNRRVRRPAGDQS